MIDLDALTNPARLPRVKLAGREMVVQPLTGAAAHRLAVTQEADASGAGMLGALLEVVAVILPALTADERAALSVEQVTAIIQLSRGQVAEVEASIAAQLDGPEKNG